MTAPPVGQTGLDDYLDPAMRGVLSSQAVQDTMRDLFGPEAMAVGPDAQESQANEIAAPNPPEEDSLVPKREEIRGLMASLYGPDFPLIRAYDEWYGQQDEAVRDMAGMPDPETLHSLVRPEEWVSWIRGRWGLHAAAVDWHLYRTAFNRLFRAGEQWLSSSGVRGPWREPPRPAEQARVTHNMVGPALDQRVRILREQRPGFQVEPENASPEAKRKADARQRALEFQYDQQDMPRITAEAAYWSQTDGVAFLHTFWDPERGPWDERMGQDGQKKPIGDLKTEVLRVEEVRVSANATATEAPFYTVIRKVIAETEAAQRWGVAATTQRAQDMLSGDYDSTGTVSSTQLPSWVLMQTNLGEGYRLRNQPTTEQYTIYVERQADILPNGLQLTVVGQAVIWGPGDLLFGMIPVSRLTDGSSDPSYYCKPIMNHWVGAQMRVNALESMRINNIRQNAGGKIFIKPNSLERETFTGAGLGLVEIDAPGTLRDSVFPMPGFSVGGDVEKALEWEVKAFEDMSGYNDVSRGEVSNETATAVAVANEHLVQVFAPPVEAAADAMADWGEIQIAGMAWGYDIPRDLGVVGSGRPDLARALTGEDFNGPASVKVDSARMMPMPMQFRLNQLNQWLQMGLITKEQYMRNQRFGWVKDLESPNEYQTARAKRVADALRLQMQPDQIPPMRWTDDEAIFQTVLQEDILLQDDLPKEVIDAAFQKWTEYAKQAQMKQNPALAQQMQQGGGQPGGAPPSPGSGAPDPNALGAQSAGMGPGPAIPSPSPADMGLALPDTGGAPSMLGGSAPQ